MTNFDEETVAGDTDIIRTGLELLQAACHTASSNAGWWRDPETDADLREGALGYMAFPTKAMLVVTEVSEAIEGHRCNKMDDKLPHRTMVECELADAFIRLMDLGGAYKLDLAGAIIEKMGYNLTRPDHQMSNRRKVGGKLY